MTKADRVKNILRGIAIVLLSIGLIVYSTDALPVVLLLIGVGMTLKGFRALIYYFVMARSMVGGKRALYRGILFLDLGLFTSSLANDPSVVIILYIAAVNAFAGFVAILRTREAKKWGSPRWKQPAVYAAFSLAMAVTVLISGLIFKNYDMTVYVYAAGLLYSAILLIASAFRRTAIVYIA